MHRDTDARDDARNPASVSELKASEATLRAILESASQGILAVDAGMHLTLVNAKLLQMFGYTREELLGQPLDNLIPERFRPLHQRHEADYVQAPKARPMGIGMDLWGRRKDGTEFPVEISLSYVREGDTLIVLAFINDITGRKRIEGELREAAKLESLAVLAGGIAHDFNNILVGIMGNTALARESLPEHSPLRARLGEIQMAGQRAADLVRQLLAYSGKGRFVVRQVDVSQLVRDAVPLIHASVGTRVQLSLDLQPVPTIEADAAQVEQLLRNLVINASEAIGDRSGLVSIRTRERELDESASRREGFNVEPGRYVEIAVEDTGSGMDEAVRSRIFDPFFSTRFIGRGLGLAAVLGIVRGHKGGIAVRTAPGAGSTFAAVFPAA